MLTDEDTRRLVSSMVEIGHNFRHRVIAEGVEDSEQVKIIQALGCESVQGYIFSKPVAADEIPKLLNKNYLD
jgi:EAL domain-containing protein (putative c-di-GMP-specific phosphodiesterase class I)